jgi:hypothetical protein
MAEIDYKARCEQYEKILGIGDYDPVKNAFIVYVKMLNQQSEYLDKFRIAADIGTIDKDAPQYKRAMEMIDGLPKMITSVDELKTRFKLTKDELRKLQPDAPVFAKITTPESIANDIGNTAGQNQH